MSFLHTQLTHKLAHARGSCLTRVGRTYYFRRRLPKPWGGEVSLSLRTTEYREAQYLAQELNRALERASLQDMTKPDIEAALRVVLKRHLERGWQEFATAPARQPVYASWWDPTDGDPHAADLKEIRDRISSTQYELKHRASSSAEEWAEEIAAEFGIPSLRLRELAFGLLQVRLQVHQEQQRWLNGQLPAIPLSGDAGTTLPSMPAPDAPRRPERTLLQLQDEFITAMKARKEKPWRMADERKAKTVYRLFTEYLGDRPPSRYKKSEVQEFYAALAQLPRHHGRSPDDKARKVRERIERAQGTDVPRLTAKTMKNYAGKLIALFEHYADVDDKNWTNPARGFKKFKQLGAASLSRSMWEGDELRQLFAAPQWNGNRTEARPKEIGPHIFANERYWLPILALYQGARLEELCRLVRHEVIEGEVPHLLITDEEPPMPLGEALQRKKGVKTKAAIRRLPIHEEVLRLGFLEYVRHVAPKSADFIFPRLKANPKDDDKRSGKFTQWFTDYRRFAGVTDDQHVFHSFRSGVVTKFLSMKGVELGNVVALIGHEDKLAKAVGLETMFKNYLKGQQIPLADLRATINRVQFSEVDLKRPSVFSDGTPFPA